MLVSDANNEVYKVTRKTLLGWELTLLQDAIFNYFIPSLASCVLYIAILACDIGVIFRQFKDEEPIWAGMTILFICMPSITSYMVIISDWDLWPNQVGFGCENIEWALVKTVEHIFFPIWQLWRYGERLFWSIDAIILQDDDERADSLEHVYAPRDIELSIFLQSYQHALPQILLQLFILMRHESELKSQTENIQVVSIILNLIKVSVTTTHFQRFKTQKLAGKQYPWYKQYKKQYETNKPLIKTNSTIELRRTGVLVPRKSMEIERLSIATITSLKKKIRSSSVLNLIGIDKHKEIEQQQNKDVSDKNVNSSNVDDTLDQTLIEANLDDTHAETVALRNIAEDPRITLRRNSSDIYLEPIMHSKPPTFNNDTSDEEEETYLETNIDDVLKEEIKAPVENVTLRNNVDECSRYNTYSTRQTIIETDKHQSKYLNRDAYNSEETVINSPKTDIYDVKRVIHVKGMVDDDFAGKSIAILWWFTFLLARVLALSAFAYFYFVETIYLVSSHYILVIAVLVYDVKSDSMNRGKLPFFIFLGYIYIFCIIEFKIKFKKATVLYYGYFFLVFFENITMCLIWFYQKLDTLQTDFWFKYIFYIVLLASVCSLSSMIFYMTINKPQKVVTKSLIKI